MLKPESHLNQTIKSEADLIKQQIKDEIFFESGNKQKLTYIQNLENDASCTNFIDIQDSSSVDSLIIQQPFSNKRTRKIEASPNPPKNLLPILASKPNYIKLAEQNIINGGFGHGSVIFKRPIIEGKYFIQFKILPDGSRFYKQATTPSSVRIGIAPFNYKVIYPIGLDESIAYKKDGKIMKNGALATKEEWQFTAGDIIGVMLTMASPYKNPDRTKVIENSSVKFYKNGNFIFQYTELKQIFYCFAVSFYNYSRVKVLQNQEQFYMKNQGASHYFSIVNQPIIYRDLKDNPLFNIQL